MQFGDRYFCQDGGDWIDPGSIQQNSCELFRVLKGVGLLEVLYLHQPTIRKPSSRPLCHSLHVSSTRHRRLCSIISSLEFHSKDPASQPLRKLAPTSSSVKPLKPQRLAASPYCLGTGSFGANSVPKASSVMSLRTCCVIKPSGDQSVMPADRDRLGAMVSSKVRELSSKACNFSKASTCLDKKLLTNIHPTPFLCKGETSVRVILRFEIYQYGRSPYHQQDGLGISPIPQPSHCPDLRGGS